MHQIDRLTCQETFERLNDYLDRELDPDEMRLVREHLEVCAYCLLEFKFEENLLREVRDRVRAVRVPADLTARILGSLGSEQGEPELEEPTG
jgi:anti-sigma factor (TIGR02949 family)